MNSGRSNDDTADLPALPAEHRVETGSARIVVDHAAVSDSGRVRKNNQDHFAILRITRTMERLATNVPPGHVPARAEEIGYGFVVADGMGGTRGGEVASQLAISTLVSLALDEYANPRLRGN